MNYAAIKKNDIANGPGVRVSLFVSGCRHRCKNCFNSESWEFSFGHSFTRDVQNEILSAADKSYISGLSILGGEPLERENQDEVIAFAKLFRARFPNKDIWCYTGFTAEELFSGVAGEGIAEQILSVVDVLVDGRFIEEQKDLSLLFRGSANQRILDAKKTLLHKKAVPMDGKWERTMSSGNILEV